MMHDRNGTLIYWIRSIHDGEWVITTPDGRNYRMPVSPRQEFDLTVAFDHCDHPEPEWQAEDREVGIFGEAWACPDCHGWADRSDYDYELDPDSGRPVRSGIVIDWQPPDPNWFELPPTGLDTDPL
jgi:hypothetical protein